MHHVTIFGLILFEFRPSGACSLWRFEYVVIDGLQFTISFPGIALLGSSLDQVDSAASKREQNGDALGDFKWINCMVWF
jgi:hypothetical protein